MYYIMDIFGILLNDGIDPELGPNIKPTVYQLMMKKDTSPDIQRKIDTIKEQFIAILDDFKKYYVLYHSSPDFPEYQRLYNEKEQQLRYLNKTLFDAANDADIEIQELSHLIATIDVELTKEKIRQKRLLKMLEIAEGKINGTETRIDDFRGEYSKMNSYNIFMFFLICVSLAIFFMVFSPKQVKDAVVNLPQNAKNQAGKAQQMYSQYRGSQQQQQQMQRR